MTEPIPDALRAALQSRYRLASVLGRGGMASVYLAEDGKHHRQVAIKVLRPDLAATLGAERFLQEIEIAARLTHPHILALHDSGEAEGFLYYVMPFIDGGSLRTRIEQRPLDVPAMLAIATPVAGALAYAHRMGVLHRDIKPENILFAQGLPVVADFGIAKAISTAGGENLTRTGFPLGTPGYMSPEQAAGLTDLDVRTDVYALAVVCYEMLVGKTPGRWPTEDAVKSGRFLEASAAHRNTLDTLPGSVEPALVRAMAIRHDQRTATPEQLLAALNGQAAPVAPVAQGAQDARGRAGPVSVAAPPRRQYSDAEIQEIMRRAAELDATQPTMSGALTIGAIEQAAAEAGIRKGMVRAAAGHLSPAGAPMAPTVTTDPNAKVPTFSAAWWAGGPTKLMVERVVAGEISEGDCAYLIEEMRTELSNAGIVSTLGKSVSWVTQRNTNGVGRDVQITITMRTGMTRITLREGLAQMAGVTFGALGGGLGGGGLGPIIGGIAGGLGAPAAAGVAAVLWVIGVLSTARTVFHYSSRSRLKQLERLGDRLADLTRSLITEAALAPGADRDLLKP